MAGRALLVYAVCPRQRAGVAGAGIAGEPLALVHAAGLAAVTGELARPPKASVAALRRYDAVLRELAQELPALLPARFGTCMESAEELALVLRARDAALRAALREVRGRVQMNLRGVEPERGPEPPAATEQGGMGGGAGAAYLRSLALAAARERETPGLAPVRAAVTRWVRSERVERSGNIASVYHLIPRASVDAYVRAAQRAAQAEGVRVLLTGPFPAYAFAGW